MIVLRIILFHWCNFRHAAKSNTCAHMRETWDKP